MRFAHRPEPVMPTFDLTPPDSIEDHFLNTVVADKIAEKKFEVEPNPNWFLQPNHKRIFGISILVAGLVAHWCGFKLPADQIKDMWTWFEGNWDSLAQAAGLIGTIIGVVSAQLRHTKEKAAITEVAKDAIVEVRKAEAVADDAKVELREVKKELVEAKKP